ncbi:MAG: methyltransferase, partial [Clostridia bacterium]|nr:methyltransferase [Clostridia bacterium]
MKERTELWPGGLSYAGDGVGTDSLALADFARTPGARRGCDLGCGSGVLMLLLARENAALAMDGVELRAEAAALCRENIEANGLADRCRVYEGDLRSAPPAAGSMDLAVSNPPYFPAG